MGTDWPPRGARRLIRLGHVLVGGVALVFAGVLMVAGRAPNADVDSVLVGLGLLLALAAVGLRARRSSLWVVHTMAMVACSR